MTAHWDQPTAADIRREEHDDAVARGECTCHHPYAFPSPYDVDDPSCPVHGEED